MSRFNDRIDVATCRDQHVALRYLLDQFDSIKPAEEARIVSLLQRVRTVLALHLRLEDDHVYPRLRKSEDPQIRDLAEHYQARMGNLAQLFADFYARWTQAGAISAQPGDYALDWQKVESALRERMAAEDAYLYSMSDMQEDSALDAD